MKISNKLTPILRCQQFDRRGYPVIIRTHGRFLPNGVSQYHLLMYTCHKRNKNYGSSIGTKTKFGENKVSNLN